MDIDKILKKILEIDDLVSKKHSHSNKNILDSITQALINNWNNAYTHISDTVKHITSTERANWNDKYTKNEVDNKISQVVSNMDWKESVATYADIATTYPIPDDGWTVNVKDTDITYRYNGSTWIAISANSIPLASSSVDGKMSKQDKIDHDDMNSKKHTHANKSIIDAITQALIDNWNAAYTHISDGVKHITTAERSLWNTVSNKVDKVTGKSLSTNDFDNSYKAKIDGISNNANKVETSTINGNIKVDGVEKTVYIHPSGTNPHGTTKADVGLSNADNTSDLNKPISTAVQSALNGKANSSHTHDDRYYTETEADSKFATKDEISTAGYGDMLKSVYDKNGDGVIDNADTVDGKHASDFAPSGYGLGGKGQRLNTSTDLNNIIANGWYDVQNPVNGPYTSGWFNFMVICSGDQTYLTQLGFGMTVNIGHVYIRTKSGSSWSAWIELYSNSVKPSASDVGLSNVDNTSDLNKPISTAVQTALNGKANSSHDHDGRYYTESEIDSKITSINTSIDGKANSLHTHNSLVSIGRKTASDLPSTWATGLYMTEIYNNGFPCSYGNCLTLKASNTAVTQICMEWKGSDATIGSMWIRNKRDSGSDAWSAWREFSFGDHNHDSRYYTETESDNKFATKSDILQAGYGDMSKFVYDTNGDGIVDRAEKLSIARKINGFPFDGSNDINLTPESLGANKWTCMYRHTEGAGVINYSKIFAITITGTYADIAECFIISCRGNRIAYVMVTASCGNSYKATNVKMDIFPLTSNSMSIVNYFRAGIIAINSTTDGIELWMKMNAWDECQIYPQTSMRRSYSITYYNGTTNATFPSFVSYVDSQLLPVKASSVNGKITWNDLKGV